MKCLAVQGTKELAGQQTGKSVSVGLKSHTRDHPAGHSLKLNGVIFRTDKKKQFCAENTVTVWKLLQEDVVMVTNMAGLKD